MPTYEYLCLSCEHTFEKMQPMTSNPLRKCPECGKKVQRLLGSGTGIIFKGSGFYETDYKRKSPSKPEKTSQKTSGKTSAAKTPEKPSSSNDSAKGTNSSSNKPNNAAKPSS